MPQQIPEHVKAERVHRLMALGDRLAREYQERFIGKVVPVLLEEKTEDGCLMGYTPEYISVKVNGGQPGCVVPIRLTAMDADGMLGCMINEG